MLCSNIDTLHDTEENVLKTYTFCYLRLDVTTTQYQNRLFALYMKDFKPGH